MSEATWAKPVQSPGEGGVIVEEMKYEKVRDRQRSWSLILWNILCENEATYRSEVAAHKFIYVLRHWRSKRVVRTTPTTFGEEIFVMVGSSK